MLKAPCFSICISDIPLTSGRLTCLYPIMSGLIRDSVFGHCMRLISRGKLFPYPEERDSSIWDTYVNSEKSTNMARYGSTDRPQNNVSELPSAEPVSSESSSRTPVVNDLPAKTPWRYEGRPGEGSRCPPSGLVWQR